MKTAVAAKLGKEPDGEPRPATRPRRTSSAVLARREPDEPTQATTNPLDNVIGYQLRRAQLLTFQEFIEYFARLKLRPAEFALITVLQNQPGLSQTEAAGMLGIKRTNFVALLDALERRGVAERRAVRGDRRSRAIHLTDNGRKLAAKANRVAAAYDDMLMDRLGGPAQRDRFLEMLGRLTMRDQTAAGQ
jgi:DNA-binding MarR family transcriptional regulator